MKEEIINLDKQGNYHDVQIDYWSNGNIFMVDNYHHGELHGYQGWFNKNKSINFKQYWNMGKWVYEESHWTNQIRIKI